MNQKQIFIVVNAPERQEFLSLAQSAHSISHNAVVQNCVDVIDGRA